MNNDQPNKAGGATGYIDGSGAGAWSFGSARRKMASQMSVGFVGAGQMATALVRGFLAASPRS